MTNLRRKRAADETGGQVLLLRWVVILAMMATVGGGVRFPRTAMA
jgi:hypothetical protein